MGLGWKNIFASTLLIFLFALVLVPPLSRAGVEGPEYKVVKKEGDFEIRDYKGYIMAQVKSGSDYDRALYSGFMKLFDYISGQNTNRSKIEMTAPVTQERSGTPEKIPMTAPVTSEKAGSEYTVSFIMPRNYTMDTLPVPDDKGITFQKVGPYRAAVIRFSGRMSQGLADRKIAELRGWMGKNDLSPKSNFLMAQYDPPWIPGFMRRNEIIVQT